MFKKKGGLIWGPGLILDPGSLSNFQDSEKRKKVSFIDEGYTCEERASKKQKVSLLFSG